MRGARRSALRDQRTRPAQMIKQTAVGLHQLAGMPDRV
jgi:hypothetical protein